MYIYYKYASDGTKIIALSCVDDCLYWYTSKYFGKLFVNTLGKILNANFLGFVHWFISIRFSQMKDHSISEYQARYAISVAAKYLDNASVKKIAKFIIPL